MFFFLLGLPAKAIEDLINRIDDDVSEVEDLDSDDTDADPTFHVDGSEEEEEDTESEEDIPEPPVSSDPTVRPRRVVWKHKDSFCPLPPAPEFVPDDNTVITGNPYELFKNYIPEFLYDLISTKSNQNYFKNNSKELKATPAEIKKFFGITVAMSYLKFPRIRMYWANSTRVPIICETMSRERYMVLRRNLKLVDDALISEEEKKSNKFWKIQPLIDAVRQACLANPRPSKVSIDEQMIPFWGKCSSRQVVRGKPNPCGLKNFVSASSDGLPLDFFLYQGAGDSITEDPACIDLNIGGKVVMRLSETLNAGSTLYIDRYFTSIYLLDLLHSERSMQATGTLDRRRIPKEITFKSDTQLLRSGRGSWDQAVRDDGQVSVIKWYDNKPVIVASSHEGTCPADICRRWDKKNKVYVDVSRPSSIRSYNINMGGIDLLDRLISFYRISARTRKWTIRVIFHFFDFALVAAWIMYRRQQKQQNTPKRDQLDSFEFRRRVAEHLVYSTTTTDPAVAVYELVESDEEEEERPIRKKKRTIPQPPAELRKSMALHLPTIPDAEKCFRCRMPGCKSNRARFQCSTCKMHLCITKERNCFKTYHEM